MSLSDPEAIEINAALQTWRQGDATLDPGLEFSHLGDLTRAHSPASQQLARDFADAGQQTPEGATALMYEVAGLVLVSQTCDVVRDCRERPYVEVAPLIRVDAGDLESTRRMKQPARAYVPAVAQHGLVADLDRIMTVEKALVARWTRTPGWERDDEVRAFAQALSRKRARFAFPDDFVEAARKLQSRIIDKHDKNSDEGAYLRALREIRVRAAPSWDDDKIQLSWWFIIEDDPVGIADADWSKICESWLKLFAQGIKYSIEPPVACRLEDMTAGDYVESDLLDFERLSLPRDEIIPAP